MGLAGGEEKPSSGCELYLKCFCTGEWRCHGALCGGGVVVGQAPWCGEEWGATQEKCSGRSTQPGGQWGLERGSLVIPRLSLGWEPAEQGNGGLAGEVLLRAEPVLGSPRAC